MAMLKTITAHNGCTNVMRYLENKQRAIARDFQNITDIDDWASEMDRTRQLYGHDKGVRYRHFIYSPDPYDGISFEKLQACASAWAKENFYEGQWSIIYHADNGIPHAHIVVNATDLRSGKKVNISNARVQQLAKSAQEVGEKYGLTSMPDIRDKEEIKRRAKVRLNLVEQALINKGITSWKLELRDAIDEAAKVSVDLKSFVNILRGTFGVKAYMTTNGICYTHPSSLRASAKSLGEAYSWEEVKSRLGKDTTAHREGLTDPTPTTHYSALYSRTKRLVALKAPGRTELLEGVLATIAKEGIENIDDFIAHTSDAREELEMIESTETLLEGKEAPLKEAARKIDRVRAVRDSDALRWLERRGIGRSDYDIILNKFQEVDKTLALIRNKKASASLRLSGLEKAYNTLLEVKAPTLRVGESYSFKTSEGASKVVLSKPPKAPKPNSQEQAFKVGLQSVKSKNQQAIKAREYWERRLKDKPIRKVISQKPPHNSRRRDGR